MGIASLNTILRKAVLPGTVADLIRESRRRFRLSRTRSAPTGKHHASRRIVGAGPAREIARRARSYREWRGWGGVGGSHPRIAPEVPAIADKVRSYGETPCLPADCRSGPCPRNRAQGALLQGMVWVGWCRSGSHPRIAPEVPAIADKVRSYGETPCLPADCRSGPCPRNRAQGALLQGMVWVGWCRSGSHPRIAPEVPAIADKVRSYGETPCLPADCRSGPCPRNRAQGALLQGMARVGWCSGPCPRFGLPEK